MDGDNKGKYTTEVGVKSSKNAKYSWLTSLGQPKTARKTTEPKSLSQQNPELLEPDSPSILQEKSDELNSPTLFPGSESTGSSDSASDVDQTDPREKSAEEESGYGNSKSKSSTKRSHNTAFTNSSALNAAKYIAAGHSLDEGAAVDITDLFSGGELRQRRGVHHSNQTGNGTGARQKRGLKYNHIPAGVSATSLHDRLTAFYLVHEKSKATDSFVKRVLAACECFALHYFKTVCICVNNSEHLLVVQLAQA
jgi:hypothetical protein